MSSSFKYAGFIPLRHLNISMARRRTRFMRILSWPLIFNMTSYVRDLSRCFMWWLGTVSWPRSMSPYGVTRQWFNGNYIGLFSSFSNLVMTRYLKASTIQMFLESDSVNNIQFLHDPVMTMCTEVTWEKKNISVVCRFWCMLSLQHGNVDNCQLFRPVKCNINSSAIYHNLHGHSFWFEHPKTLFMLLNYISYMLNA